MNVFTVCYISIINVGASVHKSEIWGNIRDKILDCQDKHCTLWLHVWLFFLPNLAPFLFVIAPDAISSYPTIWAFPTFSVTSLPEIVIGNDTALFHVSLHHFSTQRFTKPCNRCNSSPITELPIIIVYTIIALMMAVPNITSTMCLSS